MIILIWIVVQTKPQVSAPVLKMNDLLYQAAVAEDGLLTLKGLRTAAMAHLAMHEALNAVDSRYQTRFNWKNSPNKRAEIAAFQAAYDIICSQYPKLKAQFEHLITLETSSEALEARAFGTRVAHLILESRQSDGWNNEATYVWHPMAPGVYAEFSEHSGTPEGFVFGAGWAKAKPFVLPSSSCFRVKPPPEIASDAYTKAFNEVKAFGATESAVRSDDQAHLAMWWKDFIENSHNRLARQLVAQEGLDLWESSRLFALLNMAIFDAYINVFDNKFHYNHWRPFTAIRWAEHDGNGGTEPDPLWNNLHQHTYAFPSYPSAHGTASSAAMAVLAEVFGNEFQFTMETTYVDKAGPFSGKVVMDPTTRSFQSFAEAGLECSMSRVYLGIHFRYDSEVGHQLGTQIGEYITQNALRPIKKP